MCPQILLIIIALTEEKMFNFYLCSNWLPKNLQKFQQRFKSRLLGTEKIRMDIGGRSIIKLIRGRNEGNSKILNRKNNFAR